MTNFEQIKRMSKEEVVNFILSTITASKRCSVDKNFMCQWCYLENICGREREWLDEEEW